MKRPDPFDDIYVRGQKFSVKKIQKLYQRDTAQSPQKIDGIDNVWFCPSCSEFFDIEFENPKFCKRCGQRLKWPRRKKKDILKEGRIDVRKKDRGDKN